MTSVISFVTMKNKIFYIATAVFVLLFLECLLQTSSYMLSYQSVSFQHKKEKTVKILILGESTSSDLFAYTVGEKSWPMLLREEFKDKKLNIKVINTAQAGVSSTTILQDVDRYLKRWMPDMVIAMIGINDGYKDIQYMEDGGFYMEDGGFLNNFRLYRMFLNLYFRLSSQDNSENSTYSMNSIEMKEKINSYRSKALELYEQFLGDEKLFVKKLLEYLDRFENNNIKRLDIKGLVTTGTLGCVNSNNLESLECSKARRFLRYVQDAMGNSKLILGELAAVGLISDSECVDLATSYLKQGTYFDQLTRKRIIKCSLSLEASRRDELFSLMGNITYSPSKDVNNHLSLYVKTSRLGIPLVYMQYPTLDIGDLKKKFKNYRYDAKLLFFLENKENFSDVNEENYDQYFKDRLRSNFGHATTAGNQRIKENLLRLLVEEPTLSWIMRKDSSE